MRAYRTYNSPNADRSPFAAARISASSSVVAGGVSIRGIILATRLMKHGLDVTMCKWLHSGLGVLVIDTRGTCTDENIREEFVRASFSVNHPLSFVGPLLRERI